MGWTWTSMLWLQLGASWKAKAAWGLFKKKNIEVAVQRLEEWNNKLQNFLLCGLCFLDDKKLMELRDGTTMEKLRLAPGLRLRAIITGANASTVDIVEDGMVLSPPVANSCLRTVNHTGGKPETVYVEYKPYKPRRGATQPSDAMIRRVRALGNLLCQPSASDAGFHTLSCRCIIKEKDHNGRALNRYAFLFRLPDGNSGEPISLSAAITIHHSHRPTLGQRFQIAKTLATTVFQLHSVGWLHKSIRSENILFFGAPGQMYSQQYLVGFEFSRDENDTSTMEQDDALERNIYRHPDRQGPPDTRFSVLHDIYSLGVILLEIGLWRPVIGFEAFADMDPDTVKERLREHANARLPHYMGRKYTRAVLECLDQTLVDGDVVALGGLERFRESVQIAFCEKVLGEIEGGVALE
ncbi:hypothetical protein BZA05DRAFT_385302 [Tricharina praecox]|uniref:uncharacterized protein n=1 Tax=Tricharina praecox TaxID=43433 RepID=UPI00221FA7E1|nr:uncharacterized protein BZA05DRAFT_413255 [Tricharina praecox]XP_051343675.1 uncharacterized protein BZA05DRAFT_385302 [Tricharina praecox]KAI5841303.1 hypothetical protein BZA05DRAFT_413255 [Tricharina praecox]KAI5857929.1 hypothetical protein BZA05DRAFT_385302 [Tricharina praecox]